MGLTLFYIVFPHLIWIWELLGIFHGIILVPQKYYGFEYYYDLFICLEIILNYSGSFIAWEYIQINVYEDKNGLLRSQNV